jgi:hypothetical protein
MVNYKIWLESEFSATVFILTKIPRSSRKGPAVAILRQRARELQSVLKNIAEYEAIGIRAK